MKQIQQFPILESSYETEVSAAAVRFQSKDDVEWRPSWVSARESFIVFHQQGTIKMTLSAQVTTAAGDVIVSSRVLLNGKILTNTEAQQLFWPAIPGGFQTVLKLVWAFRVRPQDTIQIQFYTNSLPGSVPSSTVIGGSGSSLIVQRV